jgi:DNA primase
MPKSKFVDFKAVKVAVTMEQVLQHYGLFDQFKRSANGESLSGPCPIHKGTNATQFRVSLTKNCWNCFSGCEGGNVLDFVAKLENVTLHAAAVKLSEWFDLSAQQPPSNRKAEHPVREAQAPPADKPAKRSNPPPADDSTPNKPLGFQLENLDLNHPYLTERGLTKESIVDFGLGYCSKGMMTGRIVIPIHNVEGKVVAYAGRWPGEPTGDAPKYKLPTGFRKSLELFNLDRAIKAPTDQPLVIVEGFFDCIKLWQHGVRRVVALMGSSLSPAQEELIRKHTTPHSRVILMFDEDDAGRAAREMIVPKLAERLFVKTHIFGEENQQPENLSADEVQEILGGVV